MDARQITAVISIAVPIVFNIAFFELGRAFDYPAILRRPTDEILRRFAAGGAGLVLRWHLLFLSALAMLPLAVLLSVVLDAGPVLTALTMVVGVVAALVQGVGLARWPFAVPELARRYIAAVGDAERRSVEVVFAVLHRYLGVGIGEHVGYLATGFWTILIAVSILLGTVLPGWLAIAGLIIGVALLVGTLEFVGTNEPEGWELAGTVVPIAYIAWSIWLIMIGVLLLIG
ncbi:MAG TPA: DUF4386 domain-containing protein [Candidatus Limnocylindrales bacterium]|nr:DUF4386 domain-containing protein [Candidatus Limnocylindrales bacterium]